MNKVVAKSAFTIGLLAMFMVVPVYGGSINKDIKIEAGGKSDGESSVNGSITVGAGAVVTGDLGTVNGRIRIGRDATVENAKSVNGSITAEDGVTANNLETVNGSVKFGAGVSVKGNAEAVNGRIVLGQGSVLNGHVENVNGDISIDGGEVGDDITTVNGDVTVNNGGVVHGDIVIKKPRSWGVGQNKRKVEVIIGPGSTVGGVIRAEREIKLYISETANVGGVEGEMSMGDAVRFSGDSP